ncbi:unnamed protein product [Cunninghamella blakesleeana]
MSHIIIGSISIELSSLPSPALLLKIKYMNLIKSLLVFVSRVENIVVFGDSYSGNIKQNSNGPLWSENLAVAWNASLYSFSFSGATCNNKITSSTVPSIVDQIEMYYNQNLSLEPENTVYAFWVGYADLHKMIEENDKDYDKVLDCIMQQVANVRKVFGTNRFILFTLAPMDKMPYFSKNETERVKRKESIDAYNLQLHDKFSNLVKYHNTLEMDLVDAHDLLVDMIESPTEFGFINGNEAYWDRCQGKCNDNIDHYIWWDKIHLTGGAHRFITTSILMSNSLEPSTALPSSDKIQELLTQPGSQYKSPIYEPAYQTGIIDKVLKQLKEAKEKEELELSEGIDQDGMEKGKGNLKDDDANNNNKGKDTKKIDTTNTATDNNMDKNMTDMETSNDPWIKPLYFFAFLTIMVCLGVVLFSKQSKRKNSNLAALSGLVKNRNNGRGRFTPLRNLDSSV